MSDQVESALNDQDKADQSQDQPVSDEQGTSSISPAFTEAQLNAILEDPRFEKLVQRHSNKAVSNESKRVDELESRLDRYEKLREKGLSAEEARDRLDYEDNMEYLRSLRGGGRSEESETDDQPAAEKASSPVDIDKIKAANPDLDFSSNEVLLAISKYGSDKRALLAELGEIRLRQTDKPKASPTQAIQPGGGKSAIRSTESDDDLMGEYYRLSTDPVTHKKRMSEIEQELRERKVW